MAKELDLDELFAQQCKYSGYMPITKLKISKAMRALLNKEFGEAVRFGKLLTSGQVAIVVRSGGCGGSAGTIYRSVTKRGKKIEWKLTGHM